ncbi:MAG TPA: aspartyl/asparaginyl beta-hydroxylase domain-containing protein [Vitreimonas sp.]|jgi:hypothetical protein|nr:aspartyl/asparaginyl beta-hydroxylase domain-containing protein [Vitreimonas sp.]
MKIAHPFIQLPLKFDAARMAAEIAAIPESEWRPHPQNFPGNSMLPLVAVNGEPENESFAGPMRPTPHLERCPYVQQAMAAVGVTVGRSRLMRLSGHAEVTQHADQGYYWVNRVRVHIPVVTQPSVRFECGGHAVNMAAGECWIFDTWRLHRVINANDDQRIHLVMDTVGGEQFWNYVAAGRPQPGETPNGWNARNIGFDPDARAQLQLENRNLPEVMTPWEVETHLTFLLGEAGAHAQLGAVQKATTDFIRDWRGLWAAHGDNAAAKPFYRRRLQTFMEAVKAPASQITMGNEINLMGAILAMIGRVAVAADAPPRAAADAVVMFDRA